MVVSELSAIFSDNEQIFVLNVFHIESFNSNHDKAEIVIF